MNYSKLTTLISAAAAILPVIRHEIEQRQHSGNDENWRDFDKRARELSEAVDNARYRELSPHQKIILATYDNGEVAHLADDLEALSEHGDGLLHFLLTEVRDGDNMSYDEAISRVNSAARQLQECAWAFQEKSRTSLPG